MLVAFFRVGAVARGALAPNFAIWVAVLCAAALGEGISVPLVRGDVPVALGAVPWQIPEDCVAEAVPRGGRQFPHDPLPLWCSLPASERHGLGRARYFVVTGAVPLAAIEGVHGVARLGRVEPPPHALGRIVARTRLLCHTGGARSAEYTRRYTL